MSAFVFAMHYVHSLAATIPIRKKNEDEKNVC